MVDTEQNFTLKINHVFSTFFYLQSFVFSYLGRMGRELGALAGTGCKWLLT
jgi:hypothetical protein